jgi:hypothetical protein
MGAFIHVADIECAENGGAFGVADNVCCQEQRVTESVVDLLRDLDREPRFTEAVDKPLNGFGMTPNRRLRGATIMLCEINRWPYLSPTARAALRKTSPST